MSKTRQPEESADEFPRFDGLFFIQLKGIIKNFKFLSAYTRSLVSFSTVRGNKQLLNFQLSIFL